jgi:hypothetical protein
MIYHFINNDINEIILINNSNNEIKVKLIHIAYAN